MFSIRPNFHESLVVVSSTMITRSSFFRLIFDFFHFCRLCRSWRYSFLNAFQNPFTRLTAFFHDERRSSALVADASTRLSAEVFAEAGHRIWFGVNASESFESVEIWVNGRRFKIPSTSVTMVLKTSNWRTAPDEIPAKCFLNRPTILSHTPPLPICPPFLCSRWYRWITWWLPCMESRLVWVVLHYIFAVYNLHTIQYSTI